jgi:hypothetical protein
MNVTPEKERRVFFFVNKKEAKKTLIFGGRLRDRG